MLAPLRLPGQAVSAGSFARASLRALSLLVATRRSRPSWRGLGSASGQEGVRLRLLLAILFLPASIMVHGVIRPGGKCHLTTRIRRHSAILNC